MTRSAADPQEVSAFSILGDALEAAAESIGDATSDASASAKDAARKVKSGISSGAYHAAYGLSFGLVFGGVFLKELLPRDSAVRRGLEEGAEAAFDAIAVRKAHEAPPKEEAPARAPRTRSKAAPKPAAKATAKPAAGPRTRKTVRVARNPPE